jgi:hypothetical protein
MNLKPMAQLIHDIESATPPASGTGDSLPIPVLSDGKLTIAIFRYMWGVPEDLHGGVIYPPYRVWYHDAETGAVLREEPLDLSTVLSKVGDPLPTLGVEGFYVPREELDELIAKLYGAYDQLLPAFVRQEKDPSPEVRAAASTFAEIFPRFSGKLLKPYYDRIGKDWFPWIESITERSRPR